MNDSVQQQRNKLLHVCSTAT